jgi:hypothetical protein
MLRIMAILFGVGFIFAGVAGYMPSFNTDGLLFGFFEVNAMHNMIHIGSGVLAIMAATSHSLTRLYFKLLGLFYGVVAVLGFVWNGDMGMMMMHMNAADNFLHTGIAVVALYLGFVTKKAK